MLKYDFSQKNGKPLYQYLYECLKSDIQNGRLTARTKLPSKREMAKDNGISVKTVMNAYEQLVVEGYLISKEKRGYFVADVEAVPDYQMEPAEYSPIYTEEKWLVDFTASNAVYEKFPFSMWRKVMREVLSDSDLKLVRRAHFLGVEELRKAIAAYLYRARGIMVSPECIVIGAGIEYLYGKPAEKRSQHNPCFTGTPFSLGDSDVCCPKTGTVELGRRRGRPLYHRG